MLAGVQPTTATAIAAAVTMPAPSTGLLMTRGTPAHDGGACPRPSPRCVPCRGARDLPRGLTSPRSASASPRPKAVLSVSYAAAAALYRAGSPPSARSGCVAAAIRRHAARTSSSVRFRRTGNPSAVNGSSSTTASSPRSSLRSPPRRGVDVALVSPRGHQRHIHTPGRLTHGASRMPRRVLRRRLAAPHRARQCLMHRALACPVHQRHQAATRRAPTAARSPEPAPWARVPPGSLAAALWSHRRTR